MVQIENALIAYYLVALAPLREFIASGSEDQVVPEPSTFAELFVRALLGEAPEADSNRDGFLTGRELIAYLTGWVPKYISSQTPVSGRIKDVELDRGDFIFKLPERVENVAFGPSAPSDNFRAILRASAEPGNDAIAARAYNLETLITTAPSVCKERCEDDAPTYELKIAVPKAFSENTKLEKIELRCINGSCGTTSVAGSGPVISEDGRLSSASLRAWGASSTWRLSAALGVTNEGDQVTVIDTVSQAVQKVDPSRLSIERAAQRPSADQEKQVEALLPKLESDVASERRGARYQLATILTTASAETTAALIRRIPTGSYRYQLGVSEALSRIATGWVAADSITIDIVSHLTESRDHSLKDSAKAALKNAARFAYYGEGLTFLSATGSASDTRLKNISGPALLKTKMNVNLRSAPSPEANVLQTLRSGECVRGYTRYVLDAGMRGDLLALKVALAPCVIGYGEIATRLASRPDADAATNPYRVWIAEYAGESYKRSRRRRGRTCSVSPISTPRRPARQN